MKRKEQDHNEDDESDGSSQTNVDPALIVERDGCYKSSSLATNLDMMIPSGSFSSGSYCASVHGLIGCISTGPVTVCNPSTGKVTTFPVRTSLGYDPIDDKIKALTVVSTPYRNHDFLMHEVVTLGRRRIFMDTQ
ncbi:unnamed protein product [Arabidopsis lyrata]|nr:unnamed protein product [Arabidopsis lyrata]